MGPNFRSIFPFVTFTLTSERDTTTYSSTFLSECDEGKWGWNCAMDCFCPVGDECHHIRGLCSSLRCLDGYRGSACQTRKLVLLSTFIQVIEQQTYWRFCLSRSMASSQQRSTRAYVVFVGLPVLITPPSITMLTPSRWMLTWPAWDFYMDIGDGPVTQYVLQQSNRTASLLRYRREFPPLRYRNL